MSVQLGKVSKPGAHVPKDLEKTPEATTTSPVPEATDSTQDSTVQATQSQQAQGTESDDTNSGIDYSNPEQTRSVIDSLRKESAKHRTSNKELSSKLEEMGGRFSKLEQGLKGLFGEADPQATPEEQIQNLANKNQALETKTALLEIAFEHEVPKSEMKYFEFLISDEMSNLKDGEEISAEKLSEIANEVKAKSAPTSTSVGTRTNTPKTPKGDTGNNGVTADQFAKMSISEKSALYAKDKETYTRLAKNGLQ